MMGIDYEATLREVRRWPVSVRVNFVQEVLTTISSELPSLPQGKAPQKEGTLTRALGLLKSDVYYTDEMVEKIIREAKAEKYGLEESV